jgi:arsenite-transporting ATPase
MKSKKKSFLFFTGKGGLEKTSLACATALEKADEDKSVLLVSTNLASNLKDVLESEVNDKINPVKGVKIKKQRASRLEGRAGNEVDKNSKGR